MKIVENIFEEKRKLLDFVKGLFVLNADDPYLGKIKPFDGLLTFGEKNLVRKRKSHKKTERTMDELLGLGREFRALHSEWRAKNARADLAVEKETFAERNALYEATSKRFVVSAQFASNPERLAAVFRDQVSLAQLSSLGERLQRDAAGLIDRAAFQGTQIPSATVEAEVRFRDETARTAFMTEYVETLQALLAKHGDSEGERFRVALAAYPELEEPQ